MPALLSTTEVRHSQHHHHDTTSKKTMISLPNNLFQNNTMATSTSPGTPPGSTSFAPHCVRKSEQTHLSSFPFKLFDILENTSPTVTEWLPHGKSFYIHDVHLFCQEVLPHYFKHTKMASFQRQLNLYGFHRIIKGEDTGAYFHPGFIRDRPDLVCEVVRISTRTDTHTCRSAYGHWDCHDQHGNNNNNNGLYNNNFNQNGDVDNNNFNNNQVVMAKVNENVCKLDVPTTRAREHMLQQQQQQQDKLQQYHQQHLFTSLPRGSVITKYHLLNNNNNNDGKAKSPRTVADFDNHYPVKPSKQQQQENILNLVNVGVNECGKKRDRHVADSDNNDIVYKRCNNNNNNVVAATTTTMDDSEIDLFCEALFADDVDDDDCCFLDLGLFQDNDNKVEMNNNNKVNNNDNNSDTAATDIDVMSFDELFAD